MSMKRPDLVVAISIWMFITAAFFVIGILVLTSAFFFVPWFTVYDGGWGMMPWTGGWGMGGIAWFGIGIGLLVMVAYFVLALMGGIGLLQGREWGRVMGIVHAAISLFWIPVGTVIGALILVYLTRSEVREYFK
jgi:hypothetical protein